jgi:hypothetical protein
MILLVLVTDHDPLIPPIGRQVTSECAFAVSIDGGPFVPAAATGVLGAASVTLPTGTNQVEIQATPKSSNYWPLTGQFSIQADGSLAPANADVPAEFEPAAALTVGNNTVVVLVTHLSRVRDATAHALRSLSVVPQQRTLMVPATWPPAAWDSPQLDDVNYVDETVSPIQGGNIAITPQSLDPGTVDLSSSWRALTPRRQSR